MLPTKFVAVTVPPTYIPPPTPTPPMTCKAPVVVLETPVLLVMARYVVAVTCPATLVHAVVDVLYE
jgi:hypothetical protein